MIIYFITMKKKHLMLCLTAMAACMSCEQALLPESEEQEKAVLKVRVESLEQVGFAESRAGGGLGDYCTKMSFVLFDDKGEKTVTVNQEATDATFGSASMNVPFGNYHLLVIGHNGEKNCTVKSTGGVTFDRASDVTDTFWYYGEVVFTESTKDIVLSLKRVVAKMELTCLDNLPSNVRKVALKYGQATGTLDIQTGYGMTKTTITKEIEITDDMYGQSQTFSFFIFPQEDEITINVTMKAYDENGTEVGGKELKDVPMRQNAITRYRGEFFGKSVGVKANVQAEWTTIDFNPSPNNS